MEKRIKEYKITTTKKDNSIEIKSEFVPMVKNFNHKIFRKNHAKHYSFGNYHEYEDGWVPIFKNSGDCYEGRFSTYDEAKNFLNNIDEYLINPVKTEIIYHEM